MLIRNFMAFVIVFFISPPVLANTPDNFLKELVTKTEMIKVDAMLDNTSKSKIYREILIQYFDLPLIGQFILGRYWNGMNEAQQNLFMDSFTRITVNRFAPMLADASLSKLAINRYIIDQNNANFWTLETTYTTDSGKAVRIIWRGRTIGEQLKIIDIVAEGVSFAIMYRSEYSSAIKNSGIKQFLDDLQEKSLEN